MLWRLHGRRHCTLLLLFLKRPLFSVRAFARQCPGHALARPRIHQTLQIFRFQTRIIRRGLSLRRILCEAQRLALSLMMNRNPGLAVRLGEKPSTELMLFRSHISAAKPVYFRQGITEDALVKTGAGYLPVCFKNAARGSIRQQPKTLRLPECT